MSDGKYWDRAWSLIEGCTPVSEDCENCWLAGIYYRFRPEDNYEGDEQPIPDLTERYKPKWTGEIILCEHRLRLPLKVKKPTVWAIWSDLFHEKVPFEFINEVMKVIALTDRHTYLILTKRPERMKKFFEESNWDLGGFLHTYLGITVETQQRADERIPYFIQIPANKFISIEPMLGPVDLKNCLGHSISAVICGGETGPKARPMHPDWVRSLRDQCIEAGVPFFFKGWGEYKHNPLIPSTPWVSRFLRVGRKKAGRLLDDKEWNELPWRR